MKVSMKGKGLRPIRQFMAVITAMGLGVSLAACSLDKETLPAGAIGHVGGFLGGVVADDPRAALIGRDMLSRGGTAADAVSAMYFMMSVTLPSRAGLGGGGVCVSYDLESNTTQVLNFTAQTPAHSNPQERGSIAMPGNPRGFFALQARYGVLPLSNIISPAEQLARFGFTLSRQFARDLAAVGPGLLADAGAREIYASPSNPHQVAAEGEKIVQLDLATSLGIMRARGVGAMYIGSFARTLSDAMRSAGGKVSIEDLRGFVPKWGPSLRVNMGDQTAHFAPPPAAASSVAALMLGMMTYDDLYEDADAAERARLIVESGMRAFADREQWLGPRGQAVAGRPLVINEDRIDALAEGYGGLETPQRTPISALVPGAKNRHETASSTGFSAIDAYGNAVSCAVTMNAPFGSGRVAQGTGVMLAAAPDARGRGTIGLAPMLVVNEYSNQVFMAMTASGGVAAPAALVSVAANALMAGQDLKTAISQPRVHLSGDPDVTYYEPTLDRSVVSALSAAGHSTAATPVIGQVNALFCPDGLPGVSLTCQMASDPRGFGLAAGSMIMGR